MATLQKFKLLATQCGVAPSPTRSPRTSPVVQFRRRKTTLRMLLGRRSPRMAHPLIPPICSPQKKEDKDLVAAQGHKTLKDLFGSSPPFGDTKETSVGSIVSGGLNVWKAGTASPRPAWTGFRHRALLRRAWRPVLVTIPE
ncbi:uncharacterized protein LOC132185038 [Corylus avellana]|uniref:uncharacterized protein LOC132185038 n=1 Tax=Corylus avellana TaxID=13451 RepID=UPI001E200C21|nr:uncharacterized protein LOC132185038 [Corylus avellana]